MEIELANGAAILSLDPLTTVALALTMYLLGAAIRQRVKFIDRLCIPDPVVGGVLFALLNLILYLTGVAYIQLDSAYQSDMQNIFFTCVGFGVTFALLKQGGNKLLKFILCVAVLAVLQGTVGVATAKLTGVEPVLGLMTSSASLLGGHGNAAAYGAILEDLGYPSATVVGISAATFGVILGNLTGGPLGKRLIERYKLASPAEKTDGLPTGSTTLSVENQEHQERQPINVISLFAHLALISALVGFGILFQTLLDEWFGVTIPAFVGGALSAVIIRNILSRSKKHRLNLSLIEDIQEYSLGVFLSIALVSLRLWELAELAIPMLIMLTAGTILTLVFVYFVVFRVVGKDRDSAIMCSGLVGFGLGATPNALANMDALTRTYGDSKIAYLCVVVTGGIFADWILMAVNTTIVAMFA